ncbi:MAG: hypothetical protein AAF989_16280, partial [Planctomycetota bacterium]
MSDSHQDQLRKQLEHMPVSEPPAPWSVIGGSAVGGLTEIGFVPGTDDLLVLSSQGRGMFDTLSGAKIARDSNDAFDNPDTSWLTAPAIGRHNGATVSLAGLVGGGL